MAAKSKSFKDQMNPAMKFMSQPQPEEQEAPQQSKAEWCAAFQTAAEAHEVELPDEWWSCICEDYTPWQKRFAEICREVIVPEIRRAFGYD